MPMPMSTALTLSRILRLRPSSIRPTLAVALMAGLLLAACADGSPDAGSAGDDGDILLDALQVETLYQVGELDAEGWEAFGAVTSVTFGPDGSLYILDRQLSHVVHLDSDGDHVRTFGRPGEGPGEFGMPGQVVVLGSGQLAIPDLQHARVHVFGADGTFVRSVPTPHADGVPGGRLGAHGDSGLLGQKNVIIVMQAGGQAPEVPDTRPIGYWDMAEDAPEPISRVIDDAWLPQMDTETVTVSGMTIGAMTAFRPSLRTAFLPDGRMAVADSTTYAIRIVDPDQGMVDVWERPLAPWPVTESDQEDHREYLGEQGGGQMQIMGPGGAIDASELQRARIDNMAFWPERAIIASLRADEDGRLWVRRSTRGLREEGPIDLLAPDGTYLGTLPSETVIPDAFGPDGLAAWIERDEFEVQYVRVGRIAPPAPLP